MILSIFTYTTIIIHFILLVKVIEMFVTSMLPTLRHGTYWAKEFHKDYKTHGGRYAVKQHLKRRPYKMTFNRWLGMRSSFLSNYLYRYKTLILLSSTFQFAIVKFVPPIFSKIGGAIIFFSLAIGVIHQLVDRLAMGVASNVQLSMYIDVSNIEYDSISFATSDIIRRCAIELIFNILFIWAGFVALYYTISNLLPFSFECIDSIADCIYFSMVTMTTTGFGDILPISDLAKLLVVSEITMSWLIIVITIFHYGATMSVDLTSGKPNS